MYGERNILRSQRHNPSQIPSCKFYCIDSLHQWKLPDKLVIRQRDVTDIYDRYSYDAEKREALEALARCLHILASHLREGKTEA